MCGVSIFIDLRMCFYFFSESLVRAWLQGALEWLWCCAHRRGGDSLHSRSSWKRWIILLFPVHPLPVPPHPLSTSLVLHLKFPSCCLLCSFLVLCSPECCCFSAGFLTLVEVFVLGWWFKSCFSLCCDMCWEPPFCHFDDVISCYLL